jgi:hypothetical protein
MTCCPASLIEIDFLIIIFRLVTHALSGLYSHNFTLYLVFMRGGSAI